MESLTFFLSIPSPSSISSVFSRVLHLERMNSSSGCLTSPEHGRSVLRAWSSWASIPCASPGCSSSLLLAKPTRQFLPASRHGGSVVASVWSTQFGHETVIRSRTAITKSQRVYSSKSGRISISAAAAGTEELPAKLKEIVRLFQQVSDPRAKYEQLLYYAKRLKPLGKEFCTQGNKVEGCVSQVWVRLILNVEDNTVVFEADSDSLLTKGLAALLVEGFSGATVAEVLKVTPDFIQMLGLGQSLTPSRNNGFFNMLKLMQKKTLQMYMQAEAAKSASSSGR